VGEGCGDWRLNFEDEYAGKEMWLAVVQ